MLFSHKHARASTKCIDRMLDVRLCESMLTLDAHSAKYTKSLKKKKEKNKKKIENNTTTTSERQEK